MEALKPCPFCGAPAEVIHLEGGENEGGSCVSCTSCFASSNVEFEFKENLVDNWNRRADPVPALLEALKGFNLTAKQIVGATATTLTITVPISVVQQAVAAISQAEGGE